MDEVATGSRESQPGPKLVKDAGLPKRRPSRGMFVLPSLFTAGNIALGFYSITQGVQGLGGNNACFDRAALAIGFAVAFDGLDGMVARMTRTTSDFGKELDSLADVITDGMAPALLAYIWGFRLLAPDLFPAIRDKVLPLGITVCFLFLICGACRLARFNLSVNPQPRNPGRPGKKFFVGMPIPAGAGVIASVIHFQGGSPIYDPRVSIVWLLLILGTGFLMVSSWRFWSGKEVTSGGRQPFQVVVLVALGMVVVALFSKVALIVVALGYLVSGVLARLAYSWGRQRRLNAEHPRQGE